MFIGLRRLKAKFFDYTLPIFIKALLDLRLEPQSFKIFIDTKCLVLTLRPSDETFAMGGFMAKHPKNFEVLSATDGSKGVLDKDKVDARFIRRKEFNEVMEATRVKGHKILNIEEGKLLENYPQFAKIDVSEIDYIFVPNILEQDFETKVLLIHLKKLLEEKEHKGGLKIVFYELNSPLSFVNACVDVVLTITIKQDMMKLYASQYVQKENPTAVLSLNKYRSDTSGGYSEGFLVVSVKDFNSLVEGINIKNFLNDV
ncbi:n-acetylglucosaminyl-phosphatidylinositol de-N-acetylase family protein Est14A [Candidatus Gastranaerophilus sp. (ex Termes propinquus)]|nr:n-acetylglucosaminyl-phosphatidylinositol de-N-acetylase family protein Est14A [Candidatus Gastranaerophilus sp. (ex Termes propinquus)]